MWAFSCQQSYKINAHLYCGLLKRDIKKNYSNKFQNFLKNIKNLYDHGCASKKIIKVLEIIKLDKILIKKILFIGAVEFFKIAFQKLINLNVQVIGVCTKEKSKFKSDYAHLRTLCKKNKIPYKYVDDVNSKDNYNWIKSLNPDIICCFGWSNLLKKIY